MEVLEGLVCPGSKRSLGLAGGCSPAAAGTRVPASWWLGEDHTRACKLTGAGGSFRRAQLATGASRARCSPAVAMATAAGLGCSRKERRLGFYIWVRGGGVDSLRTKVSSRGRVVVWSRYGRMGGDVWRSSDQWRGAAPPSSA
jgi:hypothetical protein